MFKFLTAYTFEIDDPAVAADEILNLLDVEHSLLKNSAGLLFCSPNCIVSGVAETVAKALPFEVIGCTTYGIVVPGGMNEEMLAVAVLTSDDAFFKTGVSDSLSGDGETKIRELYERLSAPPEPSPSLLLVCHSNPNCLSGDRTLNILDRISGGTPVFGTIALGETFGSQPPRVIHNGVVYSDRTVLLMIYGGTTESRFTIRPLSSTNFSSQPALVTEAQDDRLISINNIPAAEFMEKFGIISDGKINKINSLYGFPLLVKNKDGTGLKACAIHGVEDGGVLRCGSAIAEGTILKLGNQMQEEVLRDSKEFIELIKKESGKKAYLIFSCFGRSVPLVDIKDEMRLFQDNIDETPYVFVYSRGEFCPIYNMGGGIRNRFHQYTIISVSF